MLFGLVVVLSALLLFQVQLIVSKHRAALVRGHACGLGDWKAFIVSRSHACGWPRRSDGVPVHLITLEAFRTYVAHLRSAHRILAVHVTNRHLDLEHVAAAHAQALHGVRVDSDGERLVVQPSSWILPARDARVLEHPACARSVRSP